MDRGRNATASKQYRVRQDRLAALVAATGEWTRAQAQAPQGENWVRVEVLRERNVLGLMRCAHRSGAGVAELAAATGQSRPWVRARLCATPSSRGL